MRLKIDNRFHGLEVAMRQVQADIKDIKMMTGKETQNRLDAMNIDILHNKHAILKLENEREQEPKPKQLDQSVFDHPYATDRFKYVALNADGQAVFFESKPVISNCLDIWVVHTGSVMPMLNGYDTSNWQNSLIERDKVELTGSDLCRAMLERGDKVVLCAVNDDGDCEEDFEEGAYDAICDVDEDGLFESYCSYWWHVQPVNNQGEPLTASEVGL